MKKISVTQLENQLYLQWDDSEKQKVYWHKELIYFPENGNRIYSFNKSDTVTVRYDLKNAMYVREESAHQ